MDGEDELYKTVKEIIETEIFNEENNNPTTAKVLKNTISIVALPKPLLWTISNHQPFNKNFFEDLHNSKFKKIKEFYSEKIISGPDWLARKFQKPKHEIIGLLNEDDQNEISSNLHLMKEFLDREDNSSLTYDNFIDKFKAFKEEKGKKYFRKENSANKLTASKSGKEFSQKKNSQIIRESVQKEQPFQSRLLYAACDVDKNIEENESNIVCPNIFFFESDLERAVFIEEYIKIIRQNFNLDKSDYEILTSILMPLTFDLLDVFNYLNEPGKYQHLLWTEEQDKIFQDSMLMFEQSDTLKSLKGEERVRRRNDFINPK